MIAWSQSLLCCDEQLLVLVFLGGIAVSAATRKCLVCDVGWLAPDQLLGVIILPTRSEELQFENYQTMIMTGTCTYADAVVFGLCYKVSQSDRYRNCY